MCVYDLPACPVRLVIISLCHSCYHGDVGKVPGRVLLSRGSPRAWLAPRQGTPELSAVCWSVAAGSVALEGWPPAEAVCRRHPLAGAGGAGDWRRRTVGRSEPSGPRWRWRSPPFPGTWHGRRHCTLGHSRLPPLSFPLRILGTSMKAQSTGPLSNGRPFLSFCRVLCASRCPVWGPVSCRKRGHRASGLGGAACRARCWLCGAGSQGAARFAAIARGQQLGAQEPVEHGLGGAGPGLAGGSGRHHGNAKCGLARDVETRQWVRIAGPQAAMRACVRSFIHSPRICLSACRVQESGRER